MAIRRLRKELEEMRTYGVTGVQDASPRDDNLFTWSAKLEGPLHSPYEGGVFRVDITFPETYPFQAPKLKFRTCIYHPSISKASGEICSAIIEEGWKPNKSVSWVLRTVLEVLQKPSSSSPLEADVAKQFERYPNEFRRTAKEWTKMYAD